MASNFTYSAIYSNIRGIPIDVQHLIIDEVVEVLPDEVCRQRLQLVQIDFPLTLTQIGDRAFDRCTALQRVALPSRLVSIGEYAFHQCTLLMDVSLNEGLEKIGMQSFAKCSNLKRIKVPSTVKTIENSAFSKCHALAEVILMEGLINIGDYVFYECYLLHEIFIPMTVERIGTSAFSRCTSLLDIGLPSRFHWMPHTFSDCSSLVVVEIPSGFDNIPDGVFSGCSSLTDVRLVEGLKRIGASSFAQATSLVTIKLPSTLILIGFGAFAGCSSLAEVGISKGLTKIATFAFLDCVTLSRIRIPSTVNTIDPLAFSGCINLVTVEFSSTIQGPLRIGDSAFRNCKSLINIAISYDPGLNIDVHFLDGCERILDQYDAADLDSEPILPLWNRFDKYPIHRKCYHSCDTSMKELQLELESFSSENNNDHEEWKHENTCDKFGMTPFHVLLSAACCRHDLMELLLETYPSTVLDYKDTTGKRAVEYLRSTWNAETKVLAELYLQKWLIDRLAGWGTNEWRFDMSRRVSNILEEEDRESRHTLTRDAFRQVQWYERVETKALLELALWKKDMVACANGGQLSSVADREYHRARCGTTFVLPNVTAFLEDVVAD